LKSRIGKSSFVFRNARAESTSGFAKRSDGFGKLVMVPELISRK